MTFEKKDVGGRPFEKPEVREVPILDFANYKPPSIEEVIEHTEKHIKIEQLNVRKTSKATKKADAQVSAKPNKPAVARIQKKL